MEKYDREFYEDLDKAFDRWKQLIGKCRNVHLIRAAKSNLYVVVWEK